MLGAVLLIILFFLINQGIFSFYERKHTFFDRKKMNLLYVYHTLFYFFYYWYASSNPSDSKGYYAETVGHIGTWFNLFGTDKTFIKFMGYPFYQIGFSSYEMMMFIFSWFGFVGFLYAYLFFRENIPVKVKVFKIDFLTLLLFLPNMHFWTVSFGKGSAIFMGLMMFTYAVSKPKRRYLLLVFGSFIIFYIRPHVFAFVAVGAVLGYLSGREKIPVGQKLMIFITLIGALIALQDQILGVVNMQGTTASDFVTNFENFTDDRSADLSKAGSGVPMSSYPLPLKFFTFWFRPLFFDAPGILGIFISFENLLYLLLFLKILKKDFISFVRKSPAMVKMSLVIFLLASFAMTFVMSNLGLIMRQKSMVMYFIFFVIYYYLAQKKYDKIVKARKLKKYREEKAASLVVKPN